MYILHLNSIILNIIIGFILSTNLSSIRLKTQKYTETTLISKIEVDLL